MWDDIFNNPHVVCGFAGGKVSVTEGKTSDPIEAFTKACFMSEEQKMLKISANSLHIGDHIHFGVDEGIGESWMDRRRINPDISGLISSVGLNSANVTVKVQGKVHRECPPNKVVKYTQLIWNIVKSARDNLATMTVNEYYRISGKSVSQILEKAVTERFDIEIWFEDDHKFHVYRDDKRIFESKSAKETAAFLEGGVR